ncbi:MAG: hypothetical protein VSS75_031260 [Candidatus Parabeggiatoa sp.]|nr:hypothetical protein [Candidatus Parabeggiatoa sp.]
MGRPNKGDESQRNNSVVVYLPPALREWINKQSQESGDSLSRVAKQAILAHAKTMGFKEEAPKPQQPETDSEMSLIARKLADLADTIEKMTNNAKCFAVYI